MKHKRFHRSSNAVQDDNDIHTNKDAWNEVGKHMHNYKCAERDISRQSDEIKTLKEEIKKLKKPPRKQSNKRPRDEVTDAWKSKDDEAWK